MELTHCCIMRFLCLTCLICRNSYSVADNVSIANISIACASKKRAGLRILAGSLNSTGPPATERIQSPSGPPARGAAFAAGTRWDGSADVDK